MRDEELAAAGIGPIERHADGATQIGPLAELVADRESGSAFAVAPRIPTLYDEVGDDTVKREPVEKLLARERHERLHRERRVEHGQLDLHEAAIQFEIDLRRNRRIDHPRCFIKIGRVERWCRPYPEVGVASWIELLEERRGADAHCPIFVSERRAQR